MRGLVVVVVVVVVVASALELVLEGDWVLGGLVDVVVPVVVEFCETMSSFDFIFLMRLSELDDELVGFFLARASRALVEALFCFLVRNQFVDVVVCWVKLDDY